MLGPGFVLCQSFLLFSGQHLAQELQSSTLLPKLSRVMAQGVLPKKEERRAVQMNTRSRISILLNVSNNRDAVKVLFQRTLCKEVKEYERPSQVSATITQHHTRPTHSIVVHSDLQSNSSQLNQSISLAVPDRTLPKKTPKTIPHMLSFPYALLSHAQISPSVLMFLLLLEPNTMPVTSHADMLFPTVLATALPRLPAHDHIFLLRNAMSLMLR